MESVGGGWGWPSEMVVDGSVSSQFISSVMIYGGFFNENMTIDTRQAALVSMSYIRMTAYCLQLYGIHSQIDDGRITISSANIQHTN